MNNEQVNIAVQKITTFQDEVLKKYVDENPHFFYKQGGLNLYIDIKAILDIKETDTDFYSDEKMIAFKIDNLRSFEEVLLRLGVNNSFEKLNKLYYDLRGFYWKMDSSPFWVAVKAY